MVFIGTNRTLRGLLSAIFVSVTRVTHWVPFARSSIGHSSCTGKEFLSNEPSQSFYVFVLLHQCSIGKSGDYSVSLVTGFNAFLRRISCLVLFIALNRLGSAILYGFQRASELAYLMRAVSWFNVGCYCCRYIYSFSILGWLASLVRVSNFESCSTLRWSYIIRSR